MNKKQKEHKSVVSGNGNAVSIVDKDLNFALRLFKRKLKESKTLDNFKQKKEFIKSSVTRRNQINKAKYIQKIRDLNS